MSTASTKQLHPLIGWQPQSQLYPVGLYQCRHGHWNPTSRGRTIAIN